MENVRTAETAARDKLHELRALLKEVAPLLVAYSGGVDSTFLLAEATATLGDRVVGVIADSPSLPRAALAGALAAAKGFGAKVEVISTTELDDPRYARNPVNRCYFCKLELFTRMDRLAAERGFHALAYGENADDAFQVRPGCGRRPRVPCPGAIANGRLNEGGNSSALQGTRFADRRHPCTTLSEFENSARHDGDQ